jgi:aminoglycoside phosphotransferase (APT) family kinase protein
MSMGKMHADEVDTDEALIRRLLEGQFPQWAALPIRRVVHSGTDNAIYRLGEDMAVRMPRIHWAVAQVERERRWLPILAPHLPLAIQVPLAIGEPAAGYPWQWSVVRWLAGENATAESLRDLREAAVDLAGFVRALQRIDATGGPQPGPTQRGVPLKVRDQYTRDRLPQLRGVVDIEAVTVAWEAAVRIPAWDGPPVWLHGDLASGNLLAVDGRLNAVIDFGPLVGDPAYDLIVAWSLFSDESRQAFREALEVDDASWARGRGIALSVAVVALPYYLKTNPAIVAASRHTIDEVLAEHRAGA